VLIRPGAPSAAGPAGRATAAPGAVPPVAPGDALHCRIRCIAWWSN